VRALISPTEFFDDCQRRYGDFFTIHTPLERTIVFTSDPDAVQEIFRGDPAMYHAGEGNAVLSPILGSSSVLLLDEADHLRQRRLLLPPFHGQLMTGYAELIGDIAARHVERWPADRPFAALPSIQAITLEVILRAVLGVEEGEGFDELRRRLRRILDALGNSTRLLLLAVTNSGWGSWGPWGASAPSSARPTSFSSSRSRRGGSPREPRSERTSSRCCSRLTMRAVGR